VEQIDQVMLSGGLSRVDGFREALAERLHASVDLFDPFRVVTWDAKKLGGLESIDVSATAAVAVGLALRQAGDR
jgi:Tfp pilus assembly PilM family ATPase